MSKPCIICYRPCPAAFDNNTGNKDATLDYNDKWKKAETLKRFSKLFQRFISDEHEKPGGSKDDENAKRFPLFERAINAGLLSCQECSKLVESFCELYKEMKSTELLLNWKVMTLMNVMSSAQRVPSRLKDFKEGVKKLLEASDVNPDEMVDFKRGLVRTCKRKLRVRDNYPRLVIKKYKPFSESGPAPSASVKDEVAVCPSPGLVIIETYCHDGLAVDAIASESEMSSSTTSAKARHEEIALNSPPEDLIDGSVSTLMRDDDDLNDDAVCGISPVSSTDHEDEIIKSVQSSTAIKTDHDSETPHEANNYEGAIGELVDADASEAVGTACEKDEAAENLAEFETEAGENVEHICDADNARDDGTGTANLLKRYKLKCPECPKLFAYVYQLILHHKQAHPHQHQPSSSREEETSAEETQITIDILKYDQVIAKVKVPQTLFPCQESSCQQPGFYLEKDLEDHSKLHGKFPCDFCRVVKSFAPELAKHELKHKNQAGSGSGDGEKGQPNCWNCPRCKKGRRKDKAKDLIHKNKYVPHYLTDHLSLPFVGERCAICKSRAFSGKFALTDHYISNHNLTEVDDDDDEQKILYCRMGGCSAYFLSMRGLNNHLKLDHGIMDKSQIKNLDPKSSFRCKDCGQCFTKKDTLKLHRQKKHVKSDTAYPCTSHVNCKRVFETKLELEKHIRRWHTSKQSFHVKECEKCNKMIRSVGFLSHMKSHKRAEDIEAGLIEPKPIPVKPLLYVCEMCGNAFKEKNRLDVHYLTHSGPSSWKFSCSVCSKKCLSQGKLNEHMRTHTKEKPFVCEICGEKYAHRHNLRSHVNSKHGDVTQDIPKKLVFTNRTSRKGIKRKKVTEEEEEEHSTSGRMSNE